MDALPFTSRPRARASVESFFSSRKITRSRMIGDGGHEQRDAVEGCGKFLEVVLAHPCGREGDQRQPEQEVHVGPERRAIYLRHDIEQVMMVVPVDR
ncbi:hypothetical protein Rvan_2021 [Rhodomicrobium vannielii ATCC 17100]|uniref:Uncharacterized protein n=1 Tax=Rhodomicrobium vannielii (strain ATCC 17100 / DSM 162 / LMG 4299 / NCIMB 10020 / ATH 3.1.1) TaxID=648757 RepID=E3I1G5_RHOVT|nr:hypothetical protein Rvan_2021 [Rhodomicrobium vannielii ATCC 17100]